MLEDLLYNVASLTPGSLELSRMPDQSVPLSTIFSGAGAVILSKFTGSIGSLTLPINYSALFLGALGANWLFSGVDLPLEHSIQQPLAVSFLGMTVAAFSMMYWLQKDSFQS